MSRYHAGRRLESQSRVEWEENAKEGVSVKGLGNPQHLPRKRHNV